MIDKKKMSERRMMRGKSGKAMNPRALQNFARQDSRVKEEKPDKEAKMPNLERDARSADVNRTAANIIANNQRIYGGVTRGMGLERDGGEGADIRREGGNMPPVDRASRAVVPAPTVAPAAPGGQGLAAAPGLANRGGVPPGLANKPGMMPPGQFKKTQPAPAVAPGGPMASPAPVMPDPDPVVGQAAMKRGGVVKKMASGGMVRGNGCAVRGKTKGRMV